MLEDQHLSETEQQKMLQSTVGELMWTFRVICGVESNDSLWGQDFLVAA